MNFLIFLLMINSVFVQEIVRDNNGDDGIIDLRKKIENILSSINFKNDTLSAESNLANQTAILPDRINKSSTETIPIETATPNSIDNNESTVETPSETTTSDPINTSSTEETTTSLPIDSNELTDKNENTNENGNENIKDDLDNSESDQNSAFVANLEPQETIVQDSKSEKTVSKNSTKNVPVIVGTDIGYVNIFPSSSSSTIVSNLPLICFLFALFFEFF